MTDTSEQRGAEAAEPVWISRRALDRGLWISILASAAGMPWFVVAIGMPMTMLMECLGASAVSIGLIVTIQQFATMAQIPAALFGEQLLYRKRLWYWCALFHRMLWIVPLFLLLLPNPRIAVVRVMILVMIAVSSVLAQVSAPLWFSWMGDLVPERMRARFWAKRQTVVMLTHLLAVLGVGYLLDFFPDPRGEGGNFYGFMWVFGLAALSGTLDVLIHWFVPEPPQADAARGDQGLRRCLVPLRDPDFRWLTISCGAWMFSLGLVGSFSILYLTRKFGVSYTGLSATMISASLGTAVAGLFWGGLMEIMGSRSFGLVMLLLSPLFGIVWFLMSPGTVVIPGLGLEVARPVLLLVCVNFFAGACYSGVGLTQVNLLTAITGRQGRTLSMAVHWTLVGFLGALGPVAGGALTDWVEGHPLAWSLPGGGTFGFIHLLVLVQMLLVWCVSVPALLRVRPLGRDLSLPLLVGNPLRAAGLMMGLAALTRAASAPRRVKALRRLGRQGDESVMGELVAQLDDPDMEVREAAVSALGELGTEAAVGELTRLLEDEHDDLSPQVARALRKASHPAGVDALVRSLDVSDRETQAESARALGVIGDRRAVGSLKALLKHSGDAKVVSASGEALARMGVFEAVYDLLPRMRGSRRLVLRRSLAVAAGDLLGRPDRFYSVLVREEKDRGVAVAALFRGVRRYIKDISSDREQRESLNRLLDEVVDAYERDDCQEASDRLCSLISRFVRQVDPAVSTMPEHKVAAHLMKGSTRLGMAYWFLYDLALWTQAAEGQVDYVDILLGIYVLSELEQGSES